MKVSVKDRKILTETTMRKRYERFGEVGISDGTNGFGLDFVEKIENRFRSNIPDTVALL